MRNNSLMLHARPVARVLFLIAAISAFFSSLRFSGLNMERLSRAFEAVVTSLVQFAVLRVLNLVDRFIQILRNVKTVTDN